MIMITLVMDFIIFIIIIIIRIILSSFPNLSAMFEVWAER